jgi:hypothetical protein
MELMMQFIKDTQVDGRFFLQGARVSVINVGDRCLVLPDLEAHTTLCTVPAQNLARLTLFRVMLVNHQVGLVDEQERWGLDAADVRSSLARCAPDCEILDIGEASG